MGYSIGIYLGENVLFKKIYRASKYYTEKEI